jgi:urease accessory protein
MSRTPRSLQIAALCLVAVPLTVHAHGDGVDWLHGVEDGAMLFATSVQYLLPVLAAALLTSDEQRRYFHYSAFAPLAVGILAGIVGNYLLEEMPFNVAVARSYLVFLGLLIVLDARFREGIVALLSLIAGLLVGSEYGLFPLGGSLASVAPTLGFLAAAALLYTVVDLLTHRYRSGWQRIAIRVAGSWIAAIALIYIAFVVKKMQ